MNENTKLTYTKNGDYYFPDIALPDNNRPFGKWGRLYLDYLKKHHPGRHARLILSGEVCTIVPLINDQAEERLRVLITQMAEAEGVTEELKAQDQMRWVQMMNNIKSRAEEIVLKEIIYEE